MKHPGHFWVCFWLLILCLSSCQDDNTRKLVSAIDRNTVALEALKSR